MPASFDLRRAWRFRLLGAAWTCVLLGALWMPGLSSALPFSGADKLVHVAMFFVFGLLTVRGVPLTPAPWGVRVGWTVVGALLLGVLTEFGQEVLSATFVDWNRSGNPLDAIADTVGGFLGALTLKKNAPTTR